MIGSRTLRVEDERFLRGEGLYVADRRTAFMAEAMIVRSPHAHARIIKIELIKAAAAPGVLAAVSARDLPTTAKPIPCRIRSHGDVTPFLQPVLARDVVRYVGEPIAVIVATTRAMAEDAAELVEIEWEPLSPVTTVHDSVCSDTVRIHERGNVATAWSI